jgi:cell wall-associated NlpC family hydrolase
MRWIVLTIIAMTFTSPADAEYPDGTLVFSNKRGIIGTVAKRITGGDQYTHVGVVLGGRVYESDWPRVTAKPIASYGKRRTTNDYYVPLQSHNVQAMRLTAESLIGTSYRLRGYFRPTRNPGLWCSPFVGRVLIAGGYPITSRDYHEPQNLLTRLDGQFQFVNRVVR